MWYLNRLGKFGKNQAKIKSLSELNDFMNSLKWCRRCPEEIDKFTTLESKVSTRRKHEDHYHYGHNVFRYAICGRSHYNKLKRIKVNWRPCAICVKKKDDLRTKRRYMRQKARRNNRQIPSFLRDELDHFKSVMEARWESTFESRVEEEVQKRLRTIRAEESCINLGQMMEVLKTDPDLLDPPSIPSGLSPPSAPDPGSDEYTDTEDASLTMSSISELQVPLPPSTPPTTPRMYRPRHRYTYSGAF
jgi:hypothetical protein